IVGFKAEGTAGNLFGAVESIVCNNGRAVVGNRDGDTSDVVAVIEFANIVIWIGLHFQDVIAARQAGHVNPLAGDVFGINVSPAALNSLIAAIVFASEIERRGVPFHDVLQAKADFSTGCDQSLIAGAQQAVFSKPFEMVMV